MLTCFSCPGKEAEERNFVVSPVEEAAWRIQEAAGRRGRRRRWNRRLCLHTGRKCGARRLPGPPRGLKGVLNGPRAPKGLPAKGPPKGWQGPRYPGNARGSLGPRELEAIAELRGIQSPAVRAVGSWGQDGVRFKDDLVRVWKNRNKTEAESREKSGFRGLRSKDGFRQDLKHRNRDVARGNGKEKTAPWSPFLKASHWEEKKEVDLKAAPPLSWEDIDHMKGFILNKIKSLAQQSPNK